MPTATERILETIQSSLAGKPKIALDTNCVQYYISNPPVQPWANCLDSIFQAGVDGRIELYVSTVVVSELLAHVYFANRHRVGYDPELDLLAIINRHFQVLDVNGDVARAAGRLRGNYLPGDKIALRTPDALIGATSLTNGHTLFVTNDAQLADALPESNRIYLRDIALEWMAGCFPSPCYDGDAVSPALSGAGLPGGAATAVLELGAVKPDPSAKWRRVLRDAFTVASAVNEPCVFFVLTEGRGRREQTKEVLFWHSGLAASRPPEKVFKRLCGHLGYSRKTSLAAFPENCIYGLVFASLSCGRLQQGQPGFVSKSTNQKEADAWNTYLSPWRVFLPCLELPRVTWLLCEDGTAHRMNTSATTDFLGQAKNVLGWKGQTDAQ